ncbi:MAG: hypothetical protein U9Q66_01555 [Patescibacteria group bacterium]|nr:hypothetical protein [Patescibacteria group bacterium]
MAGFKKVGPTKKIKKRGRPNDKVLKPDYTGHRKGELYSSCSNKMYAYVEYT